MSGNFVVVREMSGNRLFSIAVEFLASHIVQGVNFLEKLLFEA